jgi:hypothetical protein
MSQLQGAPFICECRSVVWLVDRRGCTPRLPTDVTGLGRPARPLSRRSRRDRDRATPPHHLRPEFHRNLIIDSGISVTTVRGRNHVNRKKDLNDQFL